MGLTDAYMRDQMPLEQYLGLYRVFTEEVSSLNLEDDDAETMRRNINKSNISNQMRIDRSLEYVSCCDCETSVDICRLCRYHFMAYKHWTLYDGMFHSTFVASRLGVWKTGGKRMLDMFLAKVSSVA